jgi:mannose-6-phosphate isomerase-like protein (cupin superfamily)
MPGYAVKKIDDMEAIFLGSFKRARAELGVSAFGMQVIDMPPNAEQYPEHDHGEDGMEEVYVVLRGGGEIEIDGQRLPIDPETIVRVSSGTKRKLYPGDQGMRVLAIGGVPGKAYEPAALTELGQPDPMAGAASVPAS